MKTDDLIAALSADATTPPVPLSRTWRVALVLGVGLAVALLFATLRPRPDIMEATHSVRFLLKFVVTLALALPALLIARRLADPATSGPGLLLSLIMAPTILVAAVGIELLLLPAADWVPALVGVNARWCLVFVPLFSLPVFAALFYALHAGAPADARLTGFVVGLAAGGVGATIYALHCVDDSPLFVAVWYCIGIAIVAGVGALLGPRLLRW